VKKQHVNSDGFGIIDLLLILVTLAIIGVAGYFVANNIDKKSEIIITPIGQSSQPATTSTTNPYQGWQTYTLAKEKLTFKYPSNWSLKDMSDSGNDYEALTSSIESTFHMTIGAGNAVSTANLPSGGYKVASADAVTFAGQKGYMDVDLGTDNNPNNYIYDSRLSSSQTSPTALFAARNIPSTTIFVQVYYEQPGNTSFANTTLSQVESDTNYQDALLVVNSMTY
jgi:hypothetical protein